MSQYFLVGIDEVGRGALAGPVFSAALSMPISKKNFLKFKKELAKKKKLFPDADNYFKGIKDSKKLSVKLRKKWFAKLVSEKELSFQISYVSPRKIDKINITQSANLAADRAASRICPNPSKCLFFLDGGLSIGRKFISASIVKGDEKIPVIAAASIIAKVKRDKKMLNLDKKLPQYGFAIHKGYGTLMHRRFIAEHGPSVFHRRTFIRKIKFKNYD